MKNANPDSGGAKSKRVQYNLRMPESLRTAATMASAAAGLSDTDLGMDAVAFYLGLENPELLARRQKCLAAMKNHNLGVYLKLK